MHKGRSGTTAVIASEEYSGMALSSDTDEVEA